MRTRSKVANAFCMLLLASSLAIAEDVRIGVLGLFHPHQFTVSAVDGSAILVHAGEETLVLEKSSGVHVAQVRASGTMLVGLVGTHTVRTSQITVTGRANGVADFILTVPGKITRHYRGTLELTPASGALVAIVTMDLETAVASVVAAESLSGTPLEAMKAQAVAARSYFVAGKGRHSEFDFCDTTHCQFLRAPPASGSAAQATSATAGLVLAYQSQPFAAMYTRSCSGHTKTPVEVGLPPGSYPYYSVACKYCHEHPEHWQSHVSARDAATLHKSDEASRLQINRRLGWSTAPSNSFIRQNQGDHVILKGVGRGHAIGLCQSGATAMAAAGANFQQILSHYYPNATIVQLDRAVSLR
jgi:stage II sporulation protein D